MTTDAIDPIERWTAKRRVALVGSILKSEASVAEAARKHGRTVAEMEDWGKKFLLGAENALRIIGDWGALVQPWSATQRSGLPMPGPIPCATVNPGGLISGEHYKPMPPSTISEMTLNTVGLAIGFCLFSY